MIEATTTDRHPAHEQIANIVANWRARGAAGAELTRKVRVLRTAIEDDMQRLTARRPQSLTEDLERLRALREGERMLATLAEVRP